MKRLVYIITVLAALATVFGGCSVSRYKEIKLSSFDIESFNLESSRTVNFVALVGVSNPAPAFRLDTAFATIKADGREIVHLSTSDVPVAAKKDSVYRVPVKGTLVPGINVLSMIGALKDDGMEAVTADIDAKLTIRGGIGKTIEYRDVKLEELKDKF